MMILTELKIFCLLSLIYLRHFVQIFQGRRSSMKGSRIILKTEILLHIRRKLKRGWELPFRKKRLTYKRALYVYFYVSLKFKAPDALRHTRIYSYCTGLPLVQDYGRRQNRMGVGQMTATRYPVLAAALAIWTGNNLPRSHKGNKG